MTAMAQEAAVRREAAAVNIQKVHRTASHRGTFCPFSIEERKDKDYLAMG